MLNYYNPALTAWTEGSAVWGWLIAGHLLALIVPGFIAMITEPPRLFGTRHRRTDNLVPLQPRLSSETPNVRAA